MLKFEIGDYVSFSNGLASGTIIKIEGNYITIEEESGFSVTRHSDDVD